MGFDLERGVEKGKGALGKEVLIVVVHLDGLEVVDLMHLGWELGNQPLEDPIILSLLFPAWILCNTVPDFLGVGAVGPV